jgi:hypothetical protein
VGVKYKYTQNFKNLVHDVFVFYSHSFNKLKHVLAPKKLKQIGAPKYIIIIKKATNVVTFFIMM